MSAHRPFSAAWCAFARLARIAAGALALGALAATGGDATMDASRCQLRVSTEPPGASVECRGETYHVTPLTLADLPPGELLVIARLEGYTESRRTVTLKPGERGAVDLRLEPVLGLLLVHSRPSGADVNLDEAQRGKTPLMMTDVPPGRHRLTLTMIGCKPTQVDVNIADRTPQKVEVELLSDSARLEIESTPAGAAVVLNGLDMGVTPLTLERVPAGDSTLEFRLQGFQTATQQLKLQAGQVVPLSVKLVPLPGKITVTTTPEHAKVFIDGAYKGKSPCTIADVAPGPHELRVEAAGHEPHVRAIDVLRAEERTYEIDLTRNSGIVEIVTEPAGATVYLDGEDRGPTKAGASDQVSETFRLDLVPAGEHLLQLTMKGYHSQKLTIDVKVNETVTRHIQLARRFIPDVTVTTKGLNKDMYRGVLAKRYPNGDIELEEYENIFITIRKENIVSMQPIVTPQPE